MKTFRILMMLIVGTVAVHGQGGPALSDADWASLGGGFTANGQVNAAVVDTNGNLYVAGQFQQGGGFIVAEWNGSAWSVLGSGMNAPVSALAVSGTNVFAGGSFTMAGGTSANYIARWNGSAWSALGSGMNGRVSALAVSDGTLYVWGNFTMAGGVPAGNIAQWNGSAWSAQGSGLSGDGSADGVRAPTVSGGEVHAGGNLTTAGGVPVSKSLLPSVPANIPVLAGPILNPANGHYYYLVGSNTWTGSEAWAEAMGGHLATIRNAAENQWVYDTFSGLVQRGLWIGFYDPSKDDNGLPHASNFVWVSGEPVTYTDWGPASGCPYPEPNDGAHSGTHEYYTGILWPATTRAGYWNDVPNDGYDGAYATNGVVEVIPSSSNPYNLPKPPASGSPQGTWMLETQDDSAGAQSPTNQHLSAPNLSIAAPDISSISITTNGWFLLEWAAPSNELFEVEWATNLVPPISWTTNAGGYIPPNSATNFIFVDTNPPARWLIYRLVEFR